MSACRNRVAKIRCRQFLLGSERTAERYLHSRLRGRMQEDLRGEAGTAPPPLMVEPIHSFAWVSSLCFGFALVFVTPMPSSVRNSLVWIFEAFERDPTYLTKRMFGSDAAYIDGLLCLVAADRDEPWNGLLVCTSQERHAALVDEMPELRPHPVLKKWLYIPQADPAFESIAGKMTALVLARDPRVGVEPKPRKRGVKPRLAAREK